MRKRYRSPLAKILAIWLTAIAALALSSAARAGEAAAEQVHLQLEVSINGVPAGKISDFVDLGGGRFASSVSELNELRIKTKAGLKPSDLVNLDSIDGLNYIYDEPKQTIAIITRSNNLQSNAYDARGDLDQAAVTPSDYGAVLNYTLFGSHGGADGYSGFRSSDFSGVNATLDARLIAPIGVFNQTAIVGMTLADETETLRLDSTYTFSKDDDMTRWRAGDFISGGTNWSRPVRLGGVQAQRAFSIRPDLVPTALPSISGSAAVPSAVDVYINGVKSYSKDVAAGPYQIENIPAVTGPGVAQVVSRDASGRETVQSVSFYNSPQLLKPGLSDFSIESGVTRSHYGVDSNDYGNSIVGVATLRHGIADWLTVETHGEASTTLLNGGAGVVARTFNKAVLSAAASASTSDKGTGFQLYGGFDTKIGPVSINGRVQHAFGDYDDLASLTARENPEGTFLATNHLTNSLFSFAPPRAIDSVTVSMPIAFDNSSVSATYLRYESEDSGTSELLTASYSRQLPHRASLHATGFIDLANSENTGAYVGISMPLDNNISSSVGLNARPDGIGVTATASKAVAQQPGSWGFRASDTEGTFERRSASLGYRAEAARFEAGVSQDGSTVRTSASVDGAVAVIGGSVYTSGHIDDSFAVVDAHVPDVKVQRENIVIGRTNADGKILIPNLNSYQKNKISIDPMDLPVNAEPATTYDYVRPSFKSGVYIDFNIKPASPSAIIILKGTDGAFVPVGSEVRIDGSEETYVVGFDGQAFIRDLKPANVLHITNDKGGCTAHVAFKASNDVQPVIGPELCQ